MLLHNLAARSDEPVTKPVSAATKEVAPAETKAATKRLGDFKLRLARDPMPVALTHILRNIIK